MCVLRWPPSVRLGAGLLAVFLNVTYTDHRTSILDDQIAGGMWWKGAIPRFPDDVIGFGIALNNWPV